MSDSSLASDDVAYALVSNIPIELRSKHLRSFFSAFVEADRFLCFHFLHRADIVVRPSASNDESTRTCCAVVCLLGPDRLDLISRYNGRRWLRADGSEHRLRCHIHAIKDPGNGEITLFKELKPPKLMPKGNVGTPTTYFSKLIRDCRLPGSVIRRLGLTFSKRRSRSFYSQVAYSYDNIGSRSSTPEQHPPVEREVHGESDEDECEEWERHEAFHEDCGKQERLNERLYEKELEIVWEKGGPGLVFYTDAFQRDQIETDTDSRWADEWDLDMSVYYRKPGDYDIGDKDAQDMIEMRRSDRVASGLDNDSVFKAPAERRVPSYKRRASDESPDFGDFEKHTKGIGRRLLEKHGWKLGESIGKKGRREPVALEMVSTAQRPFQKQGIGYRGEKLQRYGLTPNVPKHFIRTVYDKEPIDQDDTLLRRAELTYVKHYN